jgi:hypothetical protein
MRWQTGIKRRCDGSCAEAYVALAQADLQHSGRGWMQNPENGVKRGEDFAKQALALDELGANTRAPCSPASSSPEPQRGGCKGV